MQVPIEMTPLPIELGAYSYAPTTDEELRTRLQHLPHNVVDRLFGAVELMWAYRDVLGQDGLALLGRITGHGSLHGWLVPNQPGRIEAIFAAVKRELGEPGKHPATADDPAPQPHLRPEPVVEEEAPEAPEASPEA